MVLTATKREKKIPVEKLQEEHLAGPADESLDQVAAELKADQVVVMNETPKYEKVTFRNQRDPGYPLEFHYSSKSHPFKQYKLIDGAQYDLPLEVVKNLESCRENIHKYRRSEAGIPEVYIAGYKTHFVCERV
jgi:hypothetical protein